MKTLELPPGSACELTLSLSAPTTHRAKAVAASAQLRSMRPYSKSSHRPIIADWSDKSMRNLPAYDDILDHMHSHLLVVFMKHITQRHRASSATHITDTATGRRAWEQHPNHLLDSVLAEESLPHMTHDHLSLITKQGAFTYCNVVTNIRSLEPVHSILITFK